MKLKRIAAIAAGATLALGGLTACGSNNFRDVKNVDSHDPDYIQVYNNVDANPNLTQICIAGVGFVTTTRPDMGSWQRVPEWDAFCSTKKKG